jgi:prepilin-type N-terminal cleavage/methylation domain-containing protein
MKSMQKGFTLIELMIVVAIIGIQRPSPFRLIRPTRFVRRYQKALRSPAGWKPHLLRTTPTRERRLQPTLPSESPLRT